MVENSLKVREVKPWMKSGHCTQCLGQQALSISITQAIRELWTLATALENRLYIDEYYDMAMLNVVAGFSIQSQQKRTDKKSLME
jgi:hypothetical protein